MPYIKAAEHKAILEELEQLKQIKNDSEWECDMCKEVFYGMRNLYLWNGDKYICDTDKRPPITKGIILTIKGLRKNYLGGNVEKLILKYLYETESGDGTGEMREVSDYGEEGDGCFCIENYNNQ